MPARRPLAVICLVAVLHGLFFIWYQQPDWNTQWSDQDGYRRLGAVLAERGTFTRFPDAPKFVPEVIRTPAYPMFVAVVYRAFGVGQLPVALAQTALFAIVCGLVYAMGCAVAPRRVAFAAALMTALFPPLPYFGALVMTEVWTTLLFTASMTLAVTALHGGRSTAFAALGLLLGLTTLSRPVFVLFPIALLALGLVIAGLVRARVSGLGVRRSPSLAQWTLMLAAFAVAMLPWFTYNYVTLGRFTLSPAGGVGRGLWEGSWQSTWSGRVQNELTHLADTIDDRARLDRQVVLVAAREQVAAGPMLEYVHQWEDIRRIWVDPVDPVERAAARVRADQEYQRVAIENVTRDSWGHLAKRLARAVFILWAGEIPFRYSDINGLPPFVIRTAWALQAALFGLGLAGLTALVRAGRAGDAGLLALPILYITAVHMPLLTEARQSLPAMPVVLLLAAAGAAHLLNPSLALEPQVHEREHL